MQINNTTPELLVEYVRDGLVEQCHYGFVVLADKEKAFVLRAEDKDYPFLFTLLCKTFASKSDY